MATLEIFKTEKGSWKIISRSSTKNPALTQIASLLMESNRSSPIKIGVFNVTGGEFEPFKTVYSYISHSKEKMNKSQYYKWLKGKRQIKAKKMEEVWKPLEVKLGELEVKL